ncbi:MAG: HAD-IIA family hydrolase [Desulfobacterales bacterium]|nr:MAG: HAD-IIA family hydrolase [Desulfobacterales bacterium]
MQTDFNAVLFDVDGVLEFQGKAYPGAIELLDFLRDRAIIIRILTNSTLKSRQRCAAQLNQLGFQIDENEVITASYATAQYLKTLNPRSCWVMLKGEGLAEFAEFVHDDQNPEYIVVGDYRDGFDFQNMNKALKHLLAGSKLIIMIPNMVDHSLGEVELTVGAYGKMLEGAAKVSATYVGKPNPYVFDMALQTMNVPRHRVLMVGDSLATDIVGAKAAGIKSVLVKTGEFRASDLDGRVQPDYIVDTIQEIRALFKPR